MNTHRQYVVVRFRANDRWSYTYHNDGPPVAIGDKVKVPGKREDEGWQALEVVNVHEDVPHFETKAILGKVDPDQRDLLDIGDDADLDRERGA